MKTGDTVPVTIAGQQVTLATVKELGEGEVTLVVPATLVRMAVRTTLAPEVVTPEVVEDTSHVLLTDQVERVEAPVTPVENNVATDTTTITEGVVEPVVAATEAIDAAVEQESV